MDRREQLVSGAVKRTRILVVVWALLAAASVLLYGTSHDIPWMTVAFGAANGLFVVFVIGLTLVGSVLRMPLFSRTVGHGAVVVSMLAYAAAAGWVLVRHSSAFPTGLMGILFLSALGWVLLAWVCRRDEIRARRSGRR